MIEVGFSLSLSLSSEASLFDSSLVCLLNHSLHLPFVFYTISNMSICFGQRYCGGVLILIWDLGIDVCFIEL